MTRAQATNLGNYLRVSRKRQGLSLRALARQIHVDDTTIARIERGEIANPRPDMLADLSDALTLPIADLYLLAGYPISPELPRLDLYLAAKYPNLTVAERQRMLETAERSGPSRKDRS